MTEARAVLFVLCGLPASGKSTLAARIADSTHALVVSADAIRIERAEPARVFEEFRAELQRALLRGQSVVADSCALRSFERRRLRDLGRAASARVELYMLRTEWRVCHARNVERERPARIEWLSCAALMSEAVASVHRECWDAVYYADAAGALSLRPGLHSYVK